MADTYLCLGQAAPSATVLTTLYTVPVSTSATISSIIVCNTSGSSGSTDTFRVSIAVGGASDNIQQYIYRDVKISQQDTFIATIGVTLATTDVVRCYSGSGHCSFSLFGIQIQ
jgi:hypothetical protein